MKTEGKSGGKIRCQGCGSPAEKFQIRSELAQYRALYESDDGVLVLGELVREEPSSFAYGIHCSACGCVQPAQRVRGLEAARGTYPGSEVPQRLLRAGELVIRQLDWESCCDTPDRPGTPSRYLAAVYIEGCPMHLEAIPVAYGESGLQVAADPAFNGTLDAYAEAGSANAPFQTAMVDGRECALFATPFST